MMMTISPLILSDIQTTDLVYFDPEFEQECLKFCKNRDIDYLPSLTDPKKFYAKSGDRFQEEDIPSGQMIDGLRPIFDPVLLDRFCEYKLLFVTENQQLSGVVHFSDYNRPVVNTYLFKLIAGYERSLRKLFELKKFKTEDMFDYCKTKNRRLPNEKLEVLKKLPPFERFYLSDLICFARDRDVIAVRDEANRLRNAVMHAREFVSLEDAERGDYIYTLESFTKFFHQVTVLLEDFKRVNNRIALMTVQ